MLPLPLQFLAAWLAVLLGRVLREQVNYHERNHQGLDNELVVANDAVNAVGKMVRRDPLAVFSASTSARLHEVA